MRFGFSIVMCAACFACDASSGGGADASDDVVVASEGGDASDAAALPLPEMPQLQNNDGGVIASPRVVPIFWTNDPDQADLEAFLGELAGSQYWTQITAEYGVGALSVRTPSIVIGDAPPVAIDDSEIGPWLASKIGTDPAWPAAIDANDLYVLFYPSATSVTLFGGGKSCVTFRGYHSHSGNIVYAVKPRCGGPPTWTPLDWMTKGTSHELAEAVTDPFWDTAPGWETLDAPHAIWTAGTGDEVGDMRDVPPQAIQRFVGKYAVERTWSNVSARAGHDPCVPLLSVPYFNAAPIVGKVIAPNPQASGEVSMLGVKVPVGQSVTIPVQLFADGPMSDWTVSASGEHLICVFDASTGNSGDVRQLTITRTAPGTTSNGSTLTITSTSGALQNVWYSFVSN